MSPGPHHASALRRGTAAAAAAALLLLAGGCATAVNGEHPGRQSAGQKLDPWENWNRKVFNFNEGLDQHVLKPVATAYQKVVPSFIRTGIYNFFGNVQDAWSAVNHFLQGKPESGLQMVARFEINTLFGLLGLIDVAQEAGLERQPEDFGQTLGVWGFGAGAYIVWPILGPSSVRDSAGLPLDRSASPALLFNSYYDELGILGVQLISTRAELLGATRVIDDIALDKYSFVRDGYLARRRSLVFDGNPPEPPEPPGADAEPGAASAPQAAPAASAASGSAR
jgi:phospholipid-binding lipoprotein MlaA